MALQDIADRLIADLIPQIGQRPRNSVKLPDESRFPLILTRVLYSGTHAGDQVEVHEVGALRQEAEDLPEDAAEGGHLARFKGQLLALRDAALTHGPLFLTTMVAAGFATVDPADQDIAPYRPCPATGSSRAWWVRPTPARTRYSAPHMCRFEC